MSISQKPFLDQWAALKNKSYIWERCREMTRILPLANSTKELNVAFVQICADVFGYAAGGNPGLGWNLMSLSRNQTLSYYQGSSARDYSAVFNFLSSTGPLFDLIHKLLADPANVFEFPVTSLPGNSSTPSSPSPYGTSMTGSVPLTSFEYFFYHFINLPVRVHNQNSSSNQMYSATNGPNDSLYPVLLEDYLGHFLPIEPLQQSKLFSQEVQSSQHSPPAQTILASPVANRPSLFRKEFLMSYQKEAPAAQPVSPVISPGGNARETWRLDTIIKVISMFWLEPYALESSKTYQKDSQSQLMFPAADESIVAASIKHATHLPSIDLIRFTRLFIKHSHYFTNSCRTGSGTIYLPQALKIQVFGEHISSDVMFHFVRHVVAHWPFDASFLYILETWLSYVQPWRYVLNPQGQIIDENTCNPCDKPEKWISFIRDNLRFYNDLLGKVLGRFMKQDMREAKTAHMMFRIFKVLSQDGLISSLQMVSTMILGNPSVMPGPKSGSYLLQHQRNVQTLTSFIDDSEHDFEFPNIFSTEFKVFIRQVLHTIVECRINEREKLAKAKAEAESENLRLKSRDFLTRMISILAGKDDQTSSADSEAAEREKVIQHLDFCVDKITEIFSLKQCVDDFEESYLEEKKRFEKTSTNRHTTHDELDISGISGLGDHSPLRMNAFQPPSRPERNPDLLPVRSDEFGPAVVLFHKISKKLNHKYGETIQDLYKQNSIRGAICRQIVAAPATVVRNEKSYDENGRRIFNREFVEIPPRIVLRPLASLRSIVYFLFYMFVACVVIGKSAVTSVLLMAVMYIFYVLVGAFWSNPVTTSFHHKMN